MALKSVALSLNDEGGRKALDEKLRESPEYNSPEAAQLRLDYNQECITKIREYCDKKGIECDKDIKSAGVVFAKMSEGQIREVRSEGVINVSINAHIFRGAMSS